MPLRHLWDQLVAHLPAFVTALVVLVVLWIVARVIRAVVERVLRFSRIDKAIANTRIATILIAFEKDLTPSKAIAYLVYFAIVLVAWKAAADIVGLRAVEETLSAVLGYLPKLISALLVLTLGGYLAGLARRAVAAVLGELDSPYARLLESLTEFVLLIVVVTIAVNTLGADVSLITANLTVIISAITVTVCLLMGWALRRPAEEIITNYYVRRTINVGDRVALANVEGVASGFTPLGLMVRDDEGVEHFLPAHVIMSGLRRTERAKPHRRAKSPSKEP